MVARPLVGRIAKAKIYLQRGGWYFSIASQAMILRMFMKSAGYREWWEFIAVAAAVGIAILGVMFIEDRLGIWSAEAGLHWSRTPQTRGLARTEDDRP